MSHDEAVDAVTAAMREMVRAAAEWCPGEPIPQPTWRESLGAATAGVLAARLDRLAAAVEALAPIAPRADPGQVPGAGCCDGPCRCMHPDADDLGTPGERFAEAMADRDIAEQPQATTARRLDAVARVADAVPPVDHVAEQGHPEGCWAVSAPCLGAAVRRVLASGDPAALAGGVS